MGADKAAAGAPSATPSALIDFAAPHAGASRLQVAFGAPREVLVAHGPTEVPAVLAAAERHAQAGRWCVGHVRHEAAPAFDAALQCHPADGPLAWFAVHDQAQPWPAPTAAPYAPLQWSGGPARSRFDADIRQIHAAIAAGEVYQVNLTAPLHSPFDGSARAFFEALRRAQPRGYAAFLDTGAEQVLSVSPELFFDWRNGDILTRPMKGTAARGSAEAEDAARAEALRTSVKERAENLMIVDLLRNDVSRIAEPHSVQVPRLFHTEALPTVWQMTSDITARTRPGTTLVDVFAALFPCGSVTGAPKVSAMRWIRRLEPQPRGVYCGAVGVLRPGGAATFNVAIRTVVLRGGQATCGIGSGVTADATADGEWAEWRSKRAFLDAASVPFELLETLRLEQGTYRNLPLHLQRLERSAAHFGRVWPPQAVQQALEQLARQHADGCWRVRLALDAAGRPHVQAQPLQPTAAPVRIRLAELPLRQAHGEFVRHKTTRRAHYDAFAPRDAAIFDTLLWNEEGQLTEFTRGNLALKQDGRWLTPALDCGLLDGVERRRLLDAGVLAEAVLHREDLARAEGLAFLNSLRGWLDAVRVD